MTAETVPAGPYFGFSLPELESELTRYKAARVESGSRLQAASVNGQSYSFGPRGDWSLDEWQIQLQAAFAYLDPSRFPANFPSNSAVGMFI